MKRSTILAALTVLPLLAVGLTGCGPSPNADACKLYEASQNDLTTVMNGSREGIFTSADVRSEFASMPAGVKAAADRAHGDVLVAMQKSYHYAVTYQESQTKDNGTAFFFQMNDVVESCKKDGAEIVLKE